MRFPARMKMVTMPLLHDVFVAGLSFIASMYLRLGTNPLEYRDDPAYVLTHALVFAVIAAIVFGLSRQYRIVWRYTSMDDLFTLVKSSGVVAVLFFLSVFALTRGDNLPRTLIVLNWLVLFIFLAAPRFTYRFIKEGRGGGWGGADGRIPVLVAGGGLGTELFIRAMGADGSSPYRVVGILSAHEQNVGFRMHGIEVKGTISDLEKVMAGFEGKKNSPQRVIISDDKLSGPAVGALLERSGQVGVKLSRSPKLTEFKGSDHALPTIRPIAIEDLLNRPVAQLDREGMARLIEGKRVLVTGSGGSIGSELVRQICAFRPAHITLVDNCEYNLYAIDMEVSESFPELPRSPVLADVRHQSRISRIMGATRPELVFHAAALKHVPMIELNPNEGVLSNVLGTRNIAEACRANGVQMMVMISTDKAVNPTNVMGATKRVAEAYCQALDILEQERPSATRYVTVRFGNVLGSTGSVVPLFQKQIARGGPVTVTHPRITRYFMTIAEAVELILQASVLRCADPRGNSGKIFVLDMGEPIPILSLARQMIRLSGQVPGEGIKIEFTGLRPGEKLNEELFHAAEELVPTGVGGIRLAAPRVTGYAILTWTINRLIDVAYEGRTDETLRRIKLLVPEYSGYQIEDEGDISEAG